MEKAMRVQKAGEQTELLSGSGLAHTKRAGHAQPCAMKRLALPFLVTVLGIVSGCSSSSSPKTQVAAISVTDINGNVLTTPLTSMTVSTAAYLDVTLLNDTSNLGADWTVSCGSAPAPGTPLPPGQTVSTVCGTFTPVHTLSAPVPANVSNGAGYVTLYTAPAAPPVGGTVTLYAAAAGDPSRYASLSFPITGLPVSVGFAPQPPASIAEGAAVSLKAVVNNDYTPMGVTWSVTCAMSSCGSFSPTKTASGVATTFTAPSATGTVTVTATSVTDATKLASATITIAPIAVSVAPAKLSVATGATGLLNATVTNDVSNAGVDWSVTCATAGDCGSITAHTASGAPSTYTAPAAVPTGGTVTVTATSTTDPTAMGTSIVTITATATPAVSGILRGGKLPVAGAAISLYAAGEAGYGSPSTLLNDKTAVTTDRNGHFFVAADTVCPKADSLLYVAAKSGSAGAGNNPNLALMTALGPCNQFAFNSGQNSSIVVDETTTVAAAFSLSAFLGDAAHVGAPAANLAGLTNSFATANLIADAATGEARSTSPTGNGSVPQAEINLFSNILNRCVVSTGGKPGDGTACGDLLSPMTPATPADTLQTALFLARSGSRLATDVTLATKLFALAENNQSFTPSLTVAPQDWTLFVTYPNISALIGPQPVPVHPALDSTFNTADQSGNQWLVNRDGTVTEIIGTMPPAVAAPKLP